MSEDTKSRSEDLVKRISKNRLMIVKGDFSSIEQVAKDMRAMMDQMDRGEVDLEADSNLVTFITNLVDRSFHAKELQQQAFCGGIIQYWMYKRINEKWMGVKTKHGYENLDLLRNILDNKSDFYSLKYTGKHLDDLVVEHEVVKRANPVLYKHIDDFIKEQKKNTYSPFYLDNVNAFCKLNGFEALERLLETQDSAPDIKFLNKVLAIIGQIRYFITPEYRITFFTTIKEIMFGIIDRYDSEQLKQISKEDLNLFITTMEAVLESAVDDSIIADEIIQSFELCLALRFLNTPYIERRILGINMLISKVNMVNKSHFPCSWKRTRSSIIKGIWLTDQRFLDWLLDNKIFELFFGETLHSELVTKYYAILCFLYSKDKLTEEHFEVMWDCAINKHEAYRVNILKILSTLALKILPSHAKFLFEKVKQMDQNDFCKFTLTLVKHINKNV